MKQSQKLKWILIAGLLLFASACTLTPHANVGVSLDYYNGGFHARPNVNVGVYGSP